MSILNNSLLLGADAGAAGYQVSRSIRLNASDSAFLSRTPASAGNRKTWTWSGWVKRSAISFSAEQHLWGVTGTTDATYGEMFFGTGDTLRFAVGYNTTYGITTTRVFRDASAWYHIVLAFDATQSTAASKIKLYINGVEETTFSSDTRASLTNQDWGYNNNVAHYIGRNPNSDIRHFNGYLADIHFVDGQALTPSSFAETNATTGQWVPTAYTGSYGTNGFQLKFADNSSNTATTLGKDTSGNGNNWTPNNLSVTAGAGNDSLVDTPTSYGTGNSGGDVRGNYATLNPLDQYSTITLTNGNLEVKVAEANWRSVRANFGMTTGKWYWEVLLDNNPAYHVHGIATTAAALSTYPGNTANSWGWNYGGSLLGGNSSGTVAAYTANCVLGFAFNADTSVLNLYFNGALQSGTFTLPAGTYFPMLGVYGTNIGVANFNAGQRPFAYTAPSGFKALCDTNLPAPTIATPSTVMDVKLYTGNGGTQSITGLGFNPDLVWLKARSAAYGNVLHDAVRGAGYELVSNLTVAESFGAQYLQSFNSDGFTVGNNNAYNQSSVTYAAWAWDAGSSTVTNTSGSISSQVRANASSGFSVVTYTGNLTSAGTSTVGHGLGIAPSLVITKRRDGASNWRVQHISTSTPSRTLFLDATDAEFDLSGNGTLSRPTSSVFSVNWSTGLGVNGQTHVAYCFAPVAGYSSALSWTGNGSNDGPLLHCGFLPRFFIAKRTDAGNDWWMWDTARSSTGNPVDEWLSPNRSDGEYANDADFDFLSNGIKIRTNSATVNASGGTYIGFAWASNPFQYARAQ